MSTEAGVPEWPDTGAVQILRETVRTIISADPPAGGLEAQCLIQLVAIKAALCKRDYREAAALCGTLGSLAFALQLVALAARRMEEQEA